MRFIELFCFEMSNCQKICWGDWGGRGGGVVIHAVEAQFKEK